MACERRSFAPNPMQKGFPCERRRPRKALRSTVKNKTDSRVMAGITKTFKAMKRVLRAAGDAIGPGQYSAAGTQVICGHCKGKEFNESPNLNGGVNLVCKKCHLVFWFAKTPDSH